MRIAVCRRLLVRPVGYCKKRWSLGGYERYDAIFCICHEATGSFSTNCGSEQDSETRRCVGHRFVVDALCVTATREAEGREETDAIVRDRAPVEKNIFSLCCSERGGKKMLVEKEGSYYTNTA